MAKPIERINRITPACAGSTCFHHVENVYNKDHPRLRGEYENTCPIDATPKGSPPLARGVPTENVCGSIVIRITPACAGSTDIGRTIVFNL